MDNIELFPKHGHKVEGGLVWSIINSTFTDYLLDFNLLNTSGEIDQLIGKLKGNPRPVIIDLMASTVALRELSTNYLNSKNLRGLAVDYSDETTPPIENLLKDELGNIYLQGNLQKKNTWQSISTWLGQDKADLIMSRPEGGLHYIPTDQRFYRVILPRLWSMLKSEGGTLLLQIPPVEVLKERGMEIDVWLKNLKKKKLVLNTFQPMMILITKDQMEKNINMVY